ncbi:EpsG family protein [Flagellimonas nanhaiensis]|uniref:EpsG family protein n=1 Tax=Flagellimonas nanhaiensis TaxID=2292706 RepID=A0A371JQP0_9FLAO|nr:EpsG family protein [Allomuricauda nanhaiensis]RDY59827.1 hypothetical protein DX873_10765 [Allomuricauda nanhaiensis]
MTIQPRLAIKKYNVVSLLTLLVSPWLSAPFIFFGVFKKSRGALTLLAIFYALLSYHIIPLETNDLASHYRFFEQIEQMNLDQLGVLLESRADSMFYILMFVFSKLGLSAQVLFAFITFLTLENFFRVYYSMFKYSDKKTYGIGIVFLLLSFLWSFIFLGVRNYFAFSFVLVAFNQGVFKKKHLQGYLWLLLSSTIHFSSIVFFPIYMALLYGNNNRNYARNMFLISLLFVFLTKKTLLGIALLLPFPEQIQEKLLWYLTGKDIVEIGIENSISGRILYIILGLWMYLGYIYLFVTIRRKSILRNLTYFLFFLLNVLSVAPDPQKRYAYMARPILLFLVVYEYGIYKNKLFIYLFMVAMLLFSLVDIYVTKNIYMESFLNFGSLTTIGILSKQIEIVN